MSPKVGLFKVNIAKKDIVFVRFNMGVLSKPAITTNKQLKKLCKIKEVLISRSLNVPL